MDKAKMIRNLWDQATDWQGATIVNELYPTFVEYNGKRRPANFSIKSVARLTSKQVIHMDVVTGKSGDSVFVNHFRLQANNVLVDNGYSLLNEEQWAEWKRVHKSGLQ